MRPAESSGSSALIIRKRSISSASPPAVGNTRTGCPTVPQRARVDSQLSLDENQRFFSNMAGGLSLVVPRKRRKIGRLGETAAF